MSVAVDLGDEHGGRKLIPLLEPIKIRHESKRGRARKKPRKVYAQAMDEDLQESHHKI